MFSRRISGIISSAECSTWYAVYLTTIVAMVAVNLLSIILFVKNSNLRTRAMYLVINLTVVDMFVGGSVTFAIVLLFLLYGCEAENVFLISPEWSIVVLLMAELWFSLTSVAGIAVISLERMHATFRPFRHRNIKKWAFGVTIASVWILTAMILIPYPLISRYGDLHQQWQLLFPVYLWESYCFLCLVVIFVSYTSIALKFWCGTRPPSHGAANRQRKLTVTLFIMNIVSLLLWLPYIVYRILFPFAVLRNFSLLTSLHLKLSLVILFTQTPLLIP